MAFDRALLTGATVVSFSLLYSPEEVAFEAGDSGTEVMVCLDVERLWAPLQRLLDDGIGAWSTGPMINVGRVKVFPSEVEAALLKDPAVKEALVSATPDPRVGERPKAFVVLNESADALPQQLMAALTERVGKHERPVAIESLDDLPRTTIGKPDRKALASREAERLSATS